MESNEFPQNAKLQIKDLSDELPFLLKEHIIFKARILEIDKCIPQIQKLCEESTCLSNQVKSEDKLLSEKINQLEQEVKYLQAKNLKVKKKLDVLKSTNKQLLLENNDLKREMRDLKVLFDNIQEENIILSKQKTLANEVNDISDNFELSSEEVDNISFNKMFRAVCQKCKDLESEINFQQALNFTKEYRCISPLFEEKYFESVCIQTDDTVDTLSNLLLPNNSYKSFVSNFSEKDILKMLQKNRDKLLISINSCGYKHTNDFSKINLESMAALPEIMRNFYTFLAEVVQCVHDSFEEITKQFNEKDIINMEHNNNNFSSDMPIRGVNSQLHDNNENLDLISRKRPVVNSVTENSPKRIHNTGSKEIDYDTIYNNMRLSHYNKIDLVVSPIKSIIMPSQKKLKKNKKSYRKKIEVEGCEYFDDTIMEDKLCMSHLEINNVISTNLKFNEMSDSERMKKNVEIYAKGKKVKKLNTNFITNNPIPQIPFLYNQDNNVSQSNSDVTAGPNSLKIVEGNPKSTSIKNTQVDSTKDNVFQTNKHMENNNISYETEINMSKHISGIGKNNTMKPKIVVDKDKLDQNRDIGISSTDAKENNQGNNSCTNNEDKANNQSNYESSPNDNLGILQKYDSNKYSNSNELETNKIVDQNLDTNFGSNIDHDINNENLIDSCSEMNEETSNHLSSLNKILEADSKLEVDTVSHETKKDFILNFYTEKDKLFEENSQRLEMIEDSLIITNMNNFCRNEVSEDNINDFGENSQVNQIIDTEKLPITTSIDLSMNISDTKVVSENTVENVAVPYINNSINNCKPSTKHVYEIFDNKVPVFPELIEKYGASLINWRKLENQFQKKIDSKNENWTKIKKMQLILVEFFMNENLGTSLPRAIDKIQKDDADFIFVFTNCLLYQLNDSWDEILSKNSNPVKNVIALIGHLAKIYKGLIIYLLGGIRQKMFHKKLSDDDPYILLFVQLYIVLCMQEKNMSLLTIFLVDCLYNLHIMCLKVVDQLLTACPNLLKNCDVNAEENVLQATIKYLLLNFKSNGSKIILTLRLKRIHSSILMKFQLSEETKDVEHLLGRLLHTAKNDPSTEVYLSTILLARRENAAWVMNKVINQGFLVLLQETWDSYVSCTDDVATIFHVQTIKLCINIIGALCRTFDEANEDKELVIIMFLKTILSNKKLIPELQEAVILALIQLSRHQYDIVVNIIMCWCPNFLLSEQLLNRLKRFLIKRPRNWMIKLKNSFIKT